MPAVRAEPDEVGAAAARLGQHQVAHPACNACLQDGIEFEPMGLNLCLAHAQNFAAGNTQQIKDVPWVGDAVALAERV